MIWSRRCRTVHIRVTNVGLSLDSAIGLSPQVSVTCLCVRNVPQAQWIKFVTSRDFLGRLWSPSAASPGLTPGGLTPAGSSGSSETLSGARVLGAGCWLGAQCSSDTFSASRRLVRLPCSTVASGQCSQGTKVEHARPLCKVGSESPPSLALRSHQPSKPEGWRQRRPLPGCVRFTFVLV